MLPSDSALEQEYLRLHPIKSPDDILRYASDEAVRAREEWKRLRREQLAQEEVLAAAVSERENEARLAAIAQAAPRDSADLPTLLREAPAYEVSEVTEAIDRECAPEWYAASQSFSALEN